MRMIAVPSESSQASHSSNGAADYVQRCDEIIDNTLETTGAAILSSCSQSASEEGLTTESSIRLRSFEETRE
jgi:hypothetical protein